MFHFLKPGSTALRITVAVSLAANVVLRSVTIVLVTGWHSHMFDETGTSASISVTVVSGMPHGTVVVSLTRYNIMVIEHDQLVVELPIGDEVFKVVSDEEIKDVSEEVFDDLGNELVDEFSSRVFNDVSDDLFEGDSDEAFKEVSEEMFEYVGDEVLKVVDDSDDAVLCEAD